MPRKDLPDLVPFFFMDAVTSQSGQVRQVIAGVTANSAGDLALIRDEEVLDLLNQRKGSVTDLDAVPTSMSQERLRCWLDDARQYAREAVDSLRLPFRKPLLIDLALFWPENVDSQ
ncbi:MULTISPECIES: hypothetical protein [unclassified Thiocapsa]|uniref:hypothetical protein n=1 Tax=unclassified Thiocapsa TaxID=2641286 RepID=UPI0035B4203E